MEAEIDRLLQSFERGGLSRRQLVAHVAALATFAAGAPAVAGGRTATGARAAGAGTLQTTEGGPTFRAVGLNHIALSVTDVPRSRDFYIEHLGLSVARDGSGSAFLNCGDNFVALFRSNQAGLNHYCYAVEGYDVEGAAEKLRANNLPPRISSGRIYFDDPDGIEVQLAAPGHGP